MNLVLVGCSHHTAPVALRERLVIPESRVEATFAEWQARIGGEALILSTCNRLEFCLVPSDNDVTRETVAAFLAEWQDINAQEIRPLLYEHRDAAAVRHVFRVAAGLDSLVVGEGQIAGQIKRAYEYARSADAAGALLHALFQNARVVAKRVRRETGIGYGKASISSVAVDYVRQVFDRFHDKTVLVIGAGKMGGLTLRHLRDLQPQRILVTNRSPERASEIARDCAGQSIPWAQLDDALACADIVLSTTGAAEPIVTRARLAPILARRSGGPMVILDIAVPRDFDPAIHDGDRVCLFNIDDLQRIREQTLAERRHHIAPAEAIVDQETERFVADWARRRNGPTIAQLTDDFERKRRAILTKLMTRLNGKLTESDRKSIEGAFRLLQNQFLHGPISALGEASRDGGGSSLLDALRQLFRLGG
jgi:glutamyl-tRNA reductase